MATGNENAFTVSPSPLYDALRTKSAHLFGTCARAASQVRLAAARAQMRSTHIGLNFIGYSYASGQTFFNGISKRRELHNVVRKLFSMLYWPRLNVQTIVW